MYWRLLQERIPRALMLGQTTSAIGNRLYQMAIFWIIWRLSDSTALAGYSAIIAGAVSILGGVIVSAVVDRCDRLRLAWRVDVLRFVIAFTLPVADFLHVLSVGVVYAVVALMAGLAAFFDPVYEAALPSLIEPAKLSSFMGLMDIPARIARVAGPGMAGFLLAVMPITAFFSLDAGTFAVSAFCIWRVQRWGRVVNREERSRAVQHVRSMPMNERRGRLSDLRQSLVTLQRDPVMARIVILDGLGNVLFPVFTLGTMVLSKEVLHAGAAGYGWLIAAYGIGGIAGNALAGRSLPVRWRIGLALSGWGGIGLCFLSIGSSHSLLRILVAAMSAGVCGALAHVSRAVLMAMRVSTQELGRLHALRGVIGTSATTLGTALVGVFMQWHSVSETFTGAGVLLLVIYVLVFAPVCRAELRG